MRFSPTPIADLTLVQDWPRFEDHRGGFGRMFCETSLAQAGHPFAARQVNLSRTSARGALRGMHFQRGAAAEDKLVHCLRGRIFDVAVDLRAGSPTYGRWHGVELSSDRPEAFLIPKGCAHGFQTLEPDVEMLYVMSADYDPAQEGGLHHACPEVAIDWPLAITDLSERDRVHPGLADLDPVAVA